MKIKNSNKKLLKDIANNYYINMGLIIAADESLLINNYRFNNYI